ncbi:uncharacterized protein LOC118428174 [Branchiostoma floridae]|uniref:Uncharacterized protein LOC118428174 n=1 Tax=Branchiostoma floridae TaxID=7739 RepID=A0A9J7M7I9_BRAFL|nr:uncharacterized protein LOC118428174 [Branchiostoma floridae]
MPTSCCALNCTNRKDKGSRKKFFRIPAEPGRRAAWLRALKRSDFEQGKKNPTAAWTPRGHERVCSDHFISDEEMIADPPPESVETLRDPLPESVETLREQLTKVQEEKCKLEQFCESLQSEADNLREERDHLQEQVTSTPESPHCNLWVSISGIRLDFTNWTHVDNITFNSDWSLGTFTTTMPALVHTTKSHVETPVTSICVWTWV